MRSRWGEGGERQVGRGRRDAGWEMEERELQDYMPAELRDRSARSSHDA